MSENCFIPLTWGGRIRTIEQIRACFQNGADKVSINTAAGNPGFVSQAAEIFGSQAIVVNIDAVRDDDGALDVVFEGGRQSAGCDPIEWAREVEDRGAGELLVQSVDRDGEAFGYDYDLIERISAVTIPVIALGGVGDYRHFAKAEPAPAVAAANIWHFKEQVDRAGKRAMTKAGSTFGLMSE